MKKVYEMLKSGAENPLHIREICAKIGSEIDYEYAKLFESTPSDGFEQEAYDASSSQPRIRTSDVKSERFGKTIDYDDDAFSPSHLVSKISADEFLNPSDCTDGIRTVYPDYGEEWDDTDRVGVPMSDRLMDVLGEGRSHVW